VFFPHCLTFSFLNCRQQSFLANAASTVNFLTGHLFLAFVGFSSLSTARSRFQSVDCKVSSPTRLSLSTSRSRFQTVDRRVSSPTRLPLSTFLLVVFCWFFSLSTSRSRFQTINCRVSSPNAASTVNFPAGCVLLVLLTVDLTISSPNCRSQSFLANAASTVNFPADHVFLAFGGSSHCRPHVLVSKLSIAEFPRQRGFHCQLSRFRCSFLTASRSRFLTADNRVSSPTRLPLSTFLLVVFFSLLVVLLTVGLTISFPNCRSQSFLANAASTVNFLAGHVSLASGGSSHCQPHDLVSKLSITEFPRQRGFHCQLSYWSCFSHFWWFSSLSTSCSRF